MTKGAGSRRGRRASSRRLRDAMGTFDPAVPAACHYCQVATVVVTQMGIPWPPDMRTRDHVVPLGIGGLSLRWNVVVACYRCNQSRPQPATADPACDCQFCAAAWEQHHRMGVLK